VLIRVRKGGVSALFATARIWSVGSHDIFIEIATFKVVDTISIGGKFHCDDAKKENEGNREAQFHLLNRTGRGHEALSFYRRPGMSLRLLQKDIDMFSKSRSLLLATTLMAASLATAVAEQNNPTANMGANGSTTASQGTTDTARPTGNYAGSSTSSKAPGGTGHAAVPGSNSSQESSSAGTAEQKAGSQTTGGK
jgi:hypothetical protein